MGLDVQELQMQLFLGLAALSLLVVWLGLTLSVKHFIMVMAIMIVYAATRYKGESESLSEPKKPSKAPTQPPYT